MRLITGFGGLIMLTTERKHRVLVVSCSVDREYFDFLREEPSWDGEITVTLSVSSKVEMNILTREFSEYNPSLWRSGDDTPMITLGRSNSYFKSLYITETFGNDIRFSTTKENFEEVKKKILGLSGYKIFDFPLKDYYGLYLLR